MQNTALRNRLCRTAAARVGVLLTTLLLLLATPPAASQEDSGDPTPTRDSRFSFVGRYQVNGTIKPSPEGTTLERCRTLCERDGNECKSFYFREPDGWCVTRTKAVETDEDAKNRDWVAYNKR